MENLQVLKALFLGAFPKNLTAAGQVFDSRKKLII